MYCLFIFMSSCCVFQLQIIRIVCVHVLFSTQCSSGSIFILMQPSPPPPPPHLNSLYQRLQTNENRHVDSQRTGVMGTDKTNPSNMWEKNYSLQLDTVFLIKYNNCNSEPRASICSCRLATCHAHLHFKSWPHTCTMEHNEIAELVTIPRGLESDKATERKVQTNPCWPFQYNAHHLFACCAASGIEVQRTAGTQQHC